ncbi:hypothetical protein [Shewanella fodinae]|uniref:Uncharacterized protein n=1 Tax=Shewanella fodinae TaxID=552357 RepID=A0A4R2F168_9GAMM|nr:hypothetical protein [Shewanella fodinae]TCN75732.1 hypothetical protein EDC91_1662 [Shewanella fodinae]
MTGAEPYMRYVFLRWLFHFNTEPVLMAAEQKVHEKLGVSKRWLSESIHYLVAEGYLLKLAAVLYFPVNEHSRGKKPAAYAISPRCAELLDDFRIEVVGKVVFEWICRSPLRQRESAEMRLVALGCLAMNATGIIYEREISNKTDYFRAMTGKKYLDLHKTLEKMCKASLARKLSPLVIDSQLFGKSERGYQINPMSITASSAVIVGLSLPINTYLPIDVLRPITQMVDSLLKYYRSCQKNGNSPSLSKIAGILADIDISILRFGYEISKNKQISHHINERVIFAVEALLPMTLDRKNFLSLANDENSDNFQFVFALLKYLIPLKSENSRPELIEFPKIFEALPLDSEVFVKTIENESRCADTFFFYQKLTRIVLALLEQLTPLMNVLERHYRAEIIGCRLGLKSSILVTETQEQVLGSPIHELNIGSPGNGHQDNSETTQESSIAEKPQFVQDLSPIAIEVFCNPAKDSKGLNIPEICAVHGKHVIDNTTTERVNNKLTRFTVEVAKRRKKVAK